MLYLLVHVRTNDLKRVCFIHHVQVFDRTRKITWPRGMVVVWNDTRMMVSPWMRRVRTDSQDAVYSIQDKEDIINFSRIEHNYLSRCRVHLGAAHVANATLNHEYTCMFELDVG